MWGWFSKGKKKPAGRRASRKPARNGKNGGSVWKTRALRAVAPVASWLILTGASFGMFHGFRTFVAHDERFQLEHVQVMELADDQLVAANASDFAGTVRRLARLEEQPQLSGVQLSTIRGKLSALHPDVSNVLVRRVWPNTLFVSFVRRIPVAQVSAGRFYQVDRDGVLLSAVSNAPDPELPLIVGALTDMTNARPGQPLHSKMLDRSLHLLSDWKQARAMRDLRIQSIQAFDEQSFAFVLENRVEIRLGRLRLQDKAKEMAAVFAQLPSDPQQLPRYIDFRFDQVIIGPP